MLNFAEPSGVAVAVGKLNEGPTPQISSAALAGEKKKVWLMSPRPKWEPLEQALLGYLRWAGAEAGQIDQRGDRAADDIPVARSKRDYRLNIEHVRRGVVLRTDPAIDVVLKWQAVHCRDRVLRSDGEILHRLLGARTGGVILCRFRGAHAAAGH